LPHLGQGFVLAASQLLVSLSSWIFCLHMAHLGQHHASVTAPGGESPSELSPVHVCGIPALCQALGAVEGSLLCMPAAAQHKAMQAQPKQGAMAGRASHFAGAG
jgi:hypothetical protein